MHKRFTLSRKPPIWVIVVCMLMLMGSAAGSTPAHRWHGAPFPLRTGYAGRPSRRMGAHRHWVHTVANPALDRPYIEHRYPKPLVSIMAEVQLQKLENKIIQGISLNIKDGELFVLVGPSGAGKTTLLNMVAGLIPYHDHILVDGSCIDPLPPHKRNMGYLFQELLLFPQMSCCWTNPSAVLISEPPATSVSNSNGSSLNSTPPCSLSRRIVGPPFIAWPLIPAMCISPIIHPQGPGSTVFRAVSRIFNMRGEWPVWRCG